MVPRRARDVVGGCRLLAAILKETAESIGASNFIPPIEKFKMTTSRTRATFPQKERLNLHFMITPIVKSSCK
jgi:hypothetical protein